MSNKQFSRFEKIAHSQLCFAFRITSDANTWTNTVTNTVGYVGSYFVKQVGEVLTQDRAFATVHLQSTTVRTTIAMNE